MPCSAPIPDIQQDADRSGSSERDKRQRVGRIRTQVDPEHLTDHELDVGRWIVMAQPLPDLPVPLRAWTESPSVPDAQAKPGKRRERYCRKLPRARSTPDPAHAIEENPRRVEYEERDVEKLVHAVNPSDPEDAGAD